MLQCKKNKNKTPKCQTLKVNKKYELFEMMLKNGLKTYLKINLS